MVALQNTGAAEAWVNKRLLFNTVFAPKQFRELWFDVKAPNGEILRFICKVKAGEPQESDYRVLRPREQHTATVKLSPCFDFSQVGTYLLRANYQDGNEAPPPPPGGALHLSQLLHSAPFQLVIK